MIFMARVEIERKGCEPTPSNFILFLMKETDLLRKHVWCSERFMLEEQFFEWCKNYRDTIIKEVDNDGE